MLREMQSDDAVARAAKRRSGQWLVGVARDAETVRLADVAFWQGLDGSARLNAIGELVSDFVQMRGGQGNGVEPRLQRSVGGVRRA